MTYQTFVIGSIMRDIFLDNYVNDLFHDRHTDANTRKRLIFTLALARMKQYGTHNN